jgi:hypothetical protein
MLRSAPIRWTWVICAVGVLLAPMAIRWPTASAAVPHVIVRPGGLHGWQPSDVLGSKVGRWTRGPGAPPSGKGSAHLSTGDALGFDPVSPIDVSTLAISYATYGTSVAAIILRVSDGAILTTAPASGPPGWQLFDAAASTSWQWDCGPDGIYDGAGTLVDYATSGCGDPEIAGFILFSSGGDAYVDRVELGSTGSTTVYDMEPATLGVKDVRVVERDGGRRFIRFRVRLSGPVDDVVRVGFRTMSGTARAGKDFIAKHGTLMLGPGSISALIKIRVVGDRREESRERFRLALGPPKGAVLGHAVAHGILVDDD